MQQHYEVEEDELLVENRVRGRSQSYLIFQEIYRQIKEDIMLEEEEGITLLLNEITLNKIYNSLRLWRRARDLGNLSHEQNQKRNH